MKLKPVILLAALFFAVFLVPATVSAAQAEPVLEAPQNLTVEVRQNEKGRPYFDVKWTNPASILELVKYWDEHGEAPLEYQIDMKVGNGAWRNDIGESITGNSLHAGYDETGIFAVENVKFDPINEGHMDNVDIKANPYSVRVRYAYYIPDEENQYYLYGPFSNVVSIGVASYYEEVSEWALPELQKADQYGLIPDILKGADMTKPITREEFCELALLLYEKSTGNMVQPVSPNPFSDTANPQILKAFGLGITKGTSATTFAPQKTVSRQECATMLFRAIKAIAPQADYSIAGVADFPDQKDIDAWAVESTKYMFKLGIIKGDNRGYFMPKATTTAQEASAYGTATREAAVLMTVRTYDKAPDIKISGAPSSPPDLNAPEKAINNVSLPEDVRAKLPDGYPDIPIAADAEFDPYVGAILPSGEDEIVIAYKSERSLASLNSLYVDFLKDTKGFYTYQQDDGKLYSVHGVKDGLEIMISVALSLGNQVGISLKPYVEY